MTAEGGPQDLAPWLCCLCWAVALLWCVVFWGVVVGALYLSWRLLHPV